MQVAQKFLPATNVHLDVIVHYPHVIVSLLYEVPFAVSCEVVGKLNVSIRHRAELEFVCPPCFKLSICVCASFLISNIELRPRF